MFSEVEEADCETALPKIEGRTEGITGGGGDEKGVDLLASVQ